jgi:hypothetical protein
MELLYFQVRRDTSRTHSITRARTHGRRHGRMGSTTRRPAGSSMPQMFVESLSFFARVPLLFLENLNC